MSTVLLAIRKMITQVKTYRSLDDNKNEAKNHHTAVVVCQEGQKTDKRPGKAKTCHDEGNPKPVQQHIAWHLCSSYFYQFISTLNGVFDEEERDIHISDK
jgi:hypothetical protein